jgi:hypothetical protein
MKGIEGLPLKYVAMIIIALIMVGALLQITGILTTSVSNATETANKTLHTVLDKSMGDVINRSSTGESTP